MIRGELKKRAEFFSKNLLGLPYMYEVRFATKEDSKELGVCFSVNNVRGCFYGEGYGGRCGCVTILIAPGLKRDLPELNAVLIHELLHFKLWYLGYPSEDNTLEFRHEAEKLMVVWDKRFDKEKRKWLRIETEEQRKRFCEYEQMFQDFIKS